MIIERILSNLFVMAISVSTVLYTILGIIVFIIVLAVIVMVHEGGHFFFAKKAGILCHEYSIGMGPLITQKKKGETMYSIRAIPIGGYVSMAGEEIESDILKDIKKVHIKLENNVIVAISANLDNPKYKDSKTYDVIEYDLLGTKEALSHELYIVLRDEEGVEQKYEVSREVMLNLNKKDEIQNAPLNRNFNSKTLGQRFMSVFAGPMMNFIFAIFIFFIMGLLYGYPDKSTTKVTSVTEDTPAYIAGIRNDDVIHSINGTVLNDWNDLSNVLNDFATGETFPSTGYFEVEYYEGGDVNNLKTTKVYPNIIIYSVMIVIKTDESGKVFINNLDNPSYDAGLRAGDEIIRVNGTSITSYSDLLVLFNKVEGSEKVNITVKRKICDSYDEIPCTVKSYSKDMLDASGVTSSKVLMGVSPGSSHSFGKTLYMPWVQTGESSLQIFKTLGLLFKSNSGVKVTDLSGPVGIVNLFISLVSSENAFYNVLYWTGLLSVNLGIINLLPFPALDGGRIVFLIYEGVTKKKPNAKVEAIVNTVGFVLLMALSVVILFSDIIKIF